MESFDKILIFFNKLLSKLFNLFKSNLEQFILSGKIYCIKVSSCLKPKLP